MVAGRPAHRGAAHTDRQSLAVGIAFTSSRTVVTTDAADASQYPRGLLGGGRPLRRSLSNRGCGESKRGSSLVMYQRFYRPSRGYRVRVTMHDLPGVVFGSKDRRNPQIVVSDILPPADLAFVPLYPH